MKDEDIRPAKIFEEYLSLSANDAELCFSNVDRNDICCPACGSLNNKFEFEKTVWFLIGKPLKGMMALDKVTV